MHNLIGKEFVYISISWLFTAALSIVVVTSPMWLFEFKFIKLIKLKIQFLSHTSHISSVCWPHVASGSRTGQHRYRTFPSLHKVPLDSAGLTHQVPFPIFNKTNAFIYFLIIKAAHTYYKNLKQNLSVDSRYKSPSLTTSLSKNWIWCPPKIFRLF